jgi:hypothetical protein
MPSGRLEGVPNLMNTEERIAQHRRASAALVEAYREGPSRGELVFGDDCAVAEDCIFWSPQIGKGVEFPYGKHLAEAGLTFPQAATLEIQTYWHHMPDFAAVGPVTLVAGEDGWAQIWKFRGTTKDGTILECHESDIIKTNAAGAIVRWEAMLDWTELGPMVELVVGKPLPDGVSMDDYFGAIAAFHGLGA